MNNLRLHLGLPKTGTKAIQSELDAHRSELRSHSIAYPTGLEGHQWLVRAIAAKDTETLDNVLADSSQCATLLFSCEGLIAHFFDFEEPALVFFEEFCAQFTKVEVYVCYRGDLLAWRKSAYKQVLINPNVLVSCLFGGTRRHDNARWIWEAEGIASQLSERIGAREVRRKYEANGTSQIAQLMSAGVVQDLSSRLCNESVSDTVAELARRVNLALGQTAARRRTLAAISHITTQGSLVMKRLRELKASREDFELLLSLLDGMAEANNPPLKIDQEEVAVIRTRVAREAAMRASISNPNR